MLGRSGYTHSEVNHSVVQTRFKQHPIKLGIGGLYISVRAISVVDREGKTTFDPRYEMDLTSVESVSQSPGNA